VLAAVLIGLGIAVQTHPGILGDSFGSIQLYSLALIPLFGPALAQWMSATFTSEISVALTQKKKLARSLESSADS